MNKIIQTKLLEIEEKFHVKVLYAVEAGSRVWGYSCGDSDYDVRFIYIHQPEWYLSIDPQGIGAKKDVIEVPVNNFLDISGWEITKALRLFRKSNPSLLEWVNSHMVYSQTSSFIDRLRSLESEFFYPKASLYHYLYMAKNNYQGLKGPKMEIKKYINALRPVLACKWIEKHQCFPPSNFHELLQKVIPKDELRLEIEDLVKRKMKGNEWIEPQVEVIHRFLESELIRIEAYIKTLKVERSDPTEKLNVLFRNVMKEVWDK